MEGQWIKTLEWPYSGLKKNQTHAAMGPFLSTEQDAVHPEFTVDYMDLGDFRRHV